MGLTNLYISNWYHAGNGKNILGSVIKSIFVNIISVHKYMCGMCKLKLSSCCITSQNNEEFCPSTVCVWIKYKLQGQGDPELAIVVKHNIC